MSGVRPSRICLRSSFSSRSWVSSDGIRHLLLTECTCRTPLHSSELSSALRPQQADLFIQPSFRHLKPHRLKLNTNVVPFGILGGHTGTANAHKHIQDG